MMNMTYKDVYFWYKKQERAIIEENIIRERQQEDKAIPEGKTLQRLIDKQIEKNRADLRGNDGE